VWLLAWSKANTHGSDVNALCCTNVFIGSLRYARLRTYVRRRTAQAGSKGR
jgi:hypothetical protein